MRASRFYLKCKTGEREARWRAYRFFEGCCQQTFGPQFSAWAQISWQSGTPV